MALRLRAFVFVLGIRFIIIIIVLKLGINQFFDTVQLSILERG